MHNTRRGEVLEAGMRITGPNDASRVVWAIGTCFFFFSFVLFIYLLLFLVYIGCYIPTTRRGEEREAATTRNGPNDSG